MDPSTASATCVGAGSGCTCTVKIPPETSTETGSYTTTAAGLLTQTVAGEAPDQNDYCVKGTKLTLSPRAGTPMMGQGSLSGTITLTKQ